MLSLNFAYSDLASFSKITSIHSFVPFLGLDREEMLLLLLAVVFFFAGTTATAQDAATFFGATGIYDLRACVNPSHITLTFDDGPSPYSLELLATLKAKSVPATFFTVGTSIQYFGADIVEAYKAGHLIASHTMTHADLPKLNDSAILTEVQGLEKMVVSRIGDAPAYIRPPYGDVDKRTGDILHGFGLKIVVWNFDSQDSNGMTGQNLTDWVINRAKMEIPTASNAFEGIIALFHETKIESVKLIGNFIDIVRAKNYTFVSLDVCAGSNAQFNYKPRQATTTTSAAAGPTSSSSTTVQATQLTATAAPTKAVVASTTTTAAVSTSTSTSSKPNGGSCSFKISPALISFIIVMAVLYM